MDFPKINFLAVVVAALSTFILGGLWYSPLLFGKAWMRANNFADADLQTFSKARMFGWSFVFSLVMAWNLAMFLAGPTTNTTWGITAGALAGMGWVAIRGSPSRMKRAPKQWRSTRSLRRRRSLVGGRIRSTDEPAMRSRGTSGLSTLMV